jgi:hypothetical protein
MTKQRTGVAYAFFDYEAKISGLARRMNRARQAANFSDSLRMKLLRDDPRSESKELPEEIAELARKTKTYGAVRSDCSHEVFGRLLRLRPKNAINLRYLVIAQDSEPEYDERSAERTVQGKANEATAGMLDEVLRIIADRESRRSSASGVFRSKVFYQGDHSEARVY